jgi:hypothetical protein
MRDFRLLQCRVWRWLSSGLLCLHNQGNTFGMKSALPLVHRLSPEQVQCLPKLRQSSRLFSESRSSTSITLFYNVFLRCIFNQIIWINLSVCMVVFFSICRLSVPTMHLCLKKFHGRFKCYEAYLCKMCMSKLTKFCIFPLFLSVVCLAYPLHLCRRANLD